MVRLSRTAQMPQVLLVAAMMAATVASSMVINYAFHHGVACGVGSADGNVLVTMLTVKAGVLPKGVQLEWQLASDADHFVGGSLVAEGVTAATPREHSGLYHASVIVRGLAPATRYYFRFQVPAAAVSDSSPAISPVGSFITPSATTGTNHVHQIAAHLDRRSLQAASNVSFQVLHINDVHNRVEGIQASGQACTAANEAAGICLGGMARLTAFLKTQKAKGPALVLDAGDESTGTLWDVVYPNHTITAALQAQMGVDAFTLGNHEFDSGLGNLASYLAALNASGIPTLGACNVDATQEPSLNALVRKWTVKEVAGVKVGVLGYLTTDTRTLAAVGKVLFGDEVSNMKQCVADFKAAHPDVNIIIAISHAGYSTDLQVAAAVPDLDLIVGGHSHTFLYGATGTERGPLLNANVSTSGEVSMGPYPTLVSGPSGRQVPVVQAGFWSKYVGALTVTFDSQGNLIGVGGSPVLMGGAVSSNNVPRDGAAMATITQNEAPVRALEGSTIGSILNTLAADRTLVRTREAPLGNFIADAMMWYIRNTSDLNPEICLVNSGSIRASLPAGNITSSQVLTMLPFGNTLVVKRMSGLAVLSALENGVSADWSTNPTPGSFPQVAGMRFRFNESAPRNQRVRTVEVRNAADGSYSPLDSCKYYNVITTDFVNTGGDGYSSVKAGESLYINGPGMDIATSSYLEDLSPVAGYAASEGRILRCNDSAGVACPSTPWPGCPISFTLMHYNDFHSRIDSAGSTDSATPCNAAQEASGACFGGMARMSTAVKSVRATGEPTLLLDAGDMTLGSLYDVVYRDRRHSAAAQNALGINAFALGNHEFDFGITELVNYLKQLPAGMALACNVNATSRPDLQNLIRRYTVVELGRTGVRVGIVGWVTPDTALSSGGVGTVTFNPIVPSVQSSVAALKAEYGPSVGIIIGLSHGGLDSDLEVAAAVGDLDLIVGGHNHHFLYGNGTERGPRLVSSNAASGQLPFREYPVVVDSVAVPGKKVPIVQAFFAGRYLGRMALNFSSAGELTSFSGNPVLLGGGLSANPVAPDGSMAQLINQYAAGLVFLNSDVIGYSNVTLSAARPAVRNQEVPLGNMVCDGLRWHLRNNTQYSSDLCLMNSGSLRADIRAGNISTGQVYAALPFGNVITLLNVTGAKLIQALETAVSGNYSDPPGRFLQVSGIAFSVNATAPPGSRLLNVSIRTAGEVNVPLNPCAHYSILTNDYIASGGDGFSMFIDTQRIIALGAPMDLAIMEYVRAFNPLPSGLYGRIARCDAGTEAGCPAARSVPDAVSPCPRPAPPAGHSGGSRSPPKRRPPPRRSPPPRRHW